MKGKLILNKETLPLILIYSARRLFEMDFIDTKPNTIASVDGLNKRFDLIFSRYFFTVLSIEPFTLEDIKFKIFEISTNRDLNDFEGNIFNNLEYLEDLLLSGNEIESIEPCAFNRLKNLRRLDLHNVKLRHLNENTFFGLDKLKKLDLNHNTIKSIDPYAFNDLKNLTFLD